MSPEAINIAIAEHCGWKPFKSPATREPAWVCPPHHCGFLYARELPDYCRDLNAMHEAALTLDIVSRRVFAEALMDVCDESRPGDVWGDQFHIQNASAAQRARAFLYTVGKWEGGAK